MRGAGASRATAVSGEGPGYAVVVADCPDLTGHKTVLASIYTLPYRWSAALRRSVVRKRRVMIVEFCTYRVKAGRRSDFMQFFGTHCVPALRAQGIRVLGPLVDLENPNRFVWFRSFPSLEERDRMKSAFHHSAVWVDELAPVVRPMLESWDFGICEASAGYSQDELVPEQLAAMPA